MKRIFSPSSCYYKNFFKKSFGHTKNLAVLIVTLSFLLLFSLSNFLLVNAQSNSNSVILPLELSYDLQTKELRWNWDYSQILTGKVEDFTLECLDGWSSLIEEGASLKPSTAFSFSDNQACRTKGVYKSRPVSSPWKPVLKTPAYKNPFIVSFLNGVYQDNKKEIHWAWTPYTQAEKYRLVDVDTQKIICELSAHQILDSKKIGCIENTTTSFQQVRRKIVIRVKGEWKRSSNTVERGRITEITRLEAYKDVYLALARNEYTEKTSTNWKTISLFDNHSLKPQDFPLSTLMKTSDEYQEYQKYHTISPSEVTQIALRLGLATKKTPEYLQETITWPEFARIVFHMAAAKTLKGKRANSTYLSFRNLLADSLKLKESKLSYKPYKKVIQKIKGNKEFQLRLEKIFNNKKLYLNQLKSRSSSGVIHSQINQLLLSL